MFSASKSTQIKKKISLYRQAEKQFKTMNPIDQQL